jgi:hypothetical protein
MFNQDSQTENRQKFQVVMLKVEILADEIKEEAKTSPAIKSNLKAIVENCKDYADYLQRPRPKYDTIR